MWSRETATTQSEFDAATKTWASENGRMMIRRYELPYPPSENHYRRRVGNRTIISKEAREYRTLVALAIACDYGAQEPMTGRLSMQVQVFVPDRRERDLGNLDKALSDALEHANVFVNDGQIDHLEYTRRGVVPGGKVIVELEPYDEGSNDGG